MLRSLSIRDVVLIDRLTLTFEPGLSVLTGETGAGKSILLGALGLTLGARADSALVRHGADRAVATAAFEVAADHPVRAILGEHEIDAGDDLLLLRRAVGTDGRSRAFVNDQPVSVALLRALGEALVEVHGQFENQRLLNPASHRGLVDAHGSLDGRVAEVGRAHRAWKEAAAAYRRAEADLAAARADEDFLRHAVDELAALDPQPGEEAELAERRTMMMHGEQLLEALNRATDRLAVGGGVDTALQGALQDLERVADRADGRLDAVIAAFDRAAVELAEGLAQLERASGDLDLDPAHLEKVEERLFALRAAARKHRVETDRLAELRDRLAAQLAGLEAGSDSLADLRRAEVAARAAYTRAAEALSAARRKAAKALDTAVAAELEPLRLGQATFRTRVEALPEDDWGETGCDRVIFEVSTNPGTPPGPLAKISSGGELARFMLALKVCLAQADPVPTMVFDEVDAGIGGAVAAAVGERLAWLARDFQVLVVTHSPQVAARGTHHWRVSKADERPGVATRVDPLAPADRTEEIARMLAGAKVTDEARAAAERLLEGAGE